MSAKSPWIILPTGAVTARSNLTLHVIPEPFYRSPAELCITSFLGRIMIDNWIFFPNT